MKAWIFLIAAILLEVLGTTSMKMSDGFTRLWPSVFIFVFYALSFVALTFSLKHIDMGPAYAVWSGVGTALIVAIGTAFFEESLNLSKLVFLAAIVIGVIGLCYSEGSA